MSSVFGSSRLQIAGKPGTIEPNLPPELEKIVFSYAYQNNPKDMKNLVLVARRVEEWLCSSIFKVVLLLRHEQFPLTFCILSKIDRYGKYIEHLAVNLTFFEICQDQSFTDFVFRRRRTVLRHVLSKLLQACPNLVNLWVYTEDIKSTKTLFPVFSPRITRLAIQLWRLFAQLPPLPLSTSQPNSPHPMYPGITHLHAIGNPFEDDKEDAQSLLLSFHFPNLTHLALARESARRQPEGLRLILKKCTKLKSVVLTRPIGGAESVVRVEVEHSRIVEVYCDSVDLWKAGAKGRGLDLWETAQANRELEAKGI